MGRGALDHGAERHEGVEPAGLRQFPDGEGLFKGPGDPDDFDVFFICSVAGEAVEGALQELAGEQVVVPADHQAEPEPLGVQAAAVFLAFHGVLSGSD